MTRASRRRRALFGGSFDPIHRGHLHVARSACARFDFPNLSFLPAWRAPHKASRDMLAVEDRLALLRLAVAEDPRFDIEEYEIRLGRPSYTFDTLSHLAAIAGDEVELYFLIGGDSLVDLPKWYRAAELVRTFTLVTVPRDPDLDLDRLLEPARVGLGEPAAEKLRRFVLPVAPLPISSTEIRARVRAGRPIDDLVPAPVAAEIAARRHYL